MTLKCNCYEGDQTGTGAHVAEIFFPGHEREEKPLTEPSHNEKARVHSPDKLRRKNLVKRHFVLDPFHPLLCSLNSTYTVTS